MMQQADSKISGKTTEYVRIGSVHIQAMKADLISEKSLLFCKRMNA